jgi:hypothetical protein
MFFGYFRQVSTTPGKNVIAGVNEAANKLTIGVNDTADKLYTGVHDTVDKFSPIINCIDDRGLFFSNRDKPVIAPEAEVGHGRQWCHSNRHE